MHLHYLQLRSLSWGRKGDAGTVAGFGSAEYSQ